MIHRVDLQKPFLGHRRPEFSGLSGETGALGPSGGISGAGGRGDRLSWASLAPCSMRFLGKREG